VIYLNASSNEERLPGAPWATSRQCRRNVQAIPSVAAMASHRRARLGHDHRNPKILRQRLHPQPQWWRTPMPNSRSASSSSHDLLPAIGNAPISGDTCGGPLGTARPSTSTCGEPCSNTSRCKGT
ncbi:unnamed protein product, partial [Symbiodinium pilosum]